MKREAQNELEQRERNIVLERNQIKTKYTGEILIGIIVLFLWLIIKN